MRVKQLLSAIGGSGDTGAVLEEFRKALENANVGFAHIGLDGRFLAVNAAYAAMLGWEQEELLGQHWNTTVFEEDYQCVAEALAVVEETGRAYLEIRGQSKDGRLGYQALTFTRSNSSGPLEGHHCFRHDITHQKDDQEALALAVESAPNGLLMLDASGKIQMANAAVEKLFGYPRKELLGRAVEILLPVRFRPGHQEYRDGFGNNHSMKAMAGRDLLGLRKDGKEIPLQVYLNALETPRGKLILATVMDIAERKLYQSQLELAKQSAESANRAKSDFLARMSHEIRTPMNLILGMNALLLESELDDKQRRHVEISYRNVRRLLRLINGILDLAKVEAGKLTLELVPFSLKEAVEESVATLAAALEQKELQVSFEVAPELWPYRMGDPERLQQILLNLLGNAIKFTASGGINVKVLPEDLKDSKNGVRFEVTDTGCGIPKDKEHLIFQAFQQAEGAMNRTYEGTGLGLSIAKTLVEMMGGRIWLDPRYGPGTKFIFTAILPRATQNSVAKRAEETHHARNPRKLKSGMRILLTDDNEENLFLLQAYLEGQSVFIDTASNGYEALEKRKQNPYDVILMDIQMPLMDGNTATCEIRKWEKETAEAAVPIVALTAHALTGAAAECKEAGCDGYLSKPVARKELLQTIGRFATSGSKATEKMTPPTGIRALRPQYLANRRKDIDNMREALRKEEFDAIKRTAHDSKGTGTGYGFPEITARARTLEQAAIDRRKDDVDVEISQMEALITRLSKEESEKMATASR